MIWEERQRARTIWTTADGISELGIPFPAWSRDLLLLTAIDGLPRPHFDCIGAGATRDMQLDTVARPGCLVPAPLLPRGGHFCMGCWASRGSRRGRRGGDLHRGESEGVFLSLLSLDDFLLGTERDGSPLLL